MTLAPSPTTHDAVRYRKDIDGLRALAVLPVILYHANIPYFTGGFVGVDIFFVISGFLITSTLIKDLSEDRFSLAGFYERRGRRILPALTAVVIFCAVAGYRLLLAGGLASFAKSALWLSFFASNIFFKNEFGYFDAAANTKPLLHTWSLSVEEQFYLFFPILLFLGWKYARKHLAGAVITLAAVSLVASYFAVKRDPTAAFYSIHYRAWELALGSILAFAFQRSVDFRLPALPQSLREGFAALGLISVLTPVFLYTIHTPFPGLAALPPCLGAFLLIWTGTATTNAGSTTVTNRLLSTRLLVEVGLMSYSLYLWHWPLLVFAKLQKGEELSLRASAGILALSVVIAWVSLQLIERPFRQRRLLPTRRQVLACSLAVLVVTGVAGFTTARYAYALRSSAQLLEDPKPITPSAPNAKYWNLDDDLHIYTIGDIAQTGVLVIGDSFANHWLNGLELFANQNHVTVHIQATPSCLPLIDTYIPQMDAEFKIPGKKRNASFGRILDSLHVSHVVLAGSWRPYIDDAPTIHPRLQLHVGDHASTTSAQQRELIRQQLDATIRFFNGRGCKVWVMLAPPQFPYNVPLKLATLVRTHKSISKSFMPRAEGLKGREPTRELLAGVVATHPSTEAEILDPFDLFCANGKCFTVANDHSLYLDNAHLSYYGSIFGQPVFQPLVRAFDLSRAAVTK